jgi:hypothetical protein
LHLMLAPKLPRGEPLPIRVSLSPLRFMPRLESYGGRKKVAGF